MRSRGSKCLHGESRFLRNLLKGDASQRRHPSSCYRHDIISLPQPLENDLLTQVEVRNRQGNILYYAPLKSKSSPKFCELFVNNKRAGPDKVQASSLQENIRYGKIGYHDQERIEYDK